MTSSTNSFEKLIDSFRKVCSNLEAKAEFNLNEIDKGCLDEFTLSAKTLQRFNEIISGINETSTELINADEILKSATKNTTYDNVITLPYEIQRDAVNCINELYNMSTPESSTCDEKLINDRNKQLLSDIIKISERNIYDVKDVESTVLEAKEIF